MKRSLSLSLLTTYYLLLTTYSFAQVQDLTINANNISYDKVNNLIEAQGSVEVVYQSTKIEGDHIIYYKNEDRVFADRGFDLDYNGIEIQGETIDYEVKNRKGNATQFHFAYAGTLLSGGKIEIEPEMFLLRNASFTTCDIAFPHYHVSALEIQLYPQYGWLVAYWGFFWLGKVPLVPVPTYIYDLLAEEKGRHNLPPFPEVGSNDEDGTYINERLAWHIKRELSGTYTISYASNKGLGGGAEANYIINENNDGNIRLYENATDGFYGGITHLYSFGEAQSKGEALPFIILPKHHHYQLETTLSSRERINYQRVSFLPNFTLRLRQGELFRKELKTDLEILAGRVAEEGNLQADRYGGNIKLHYDSLEVATAKLIPSLTLDALFYSNGARWIKFSGGLDLSKKFNKNLTGGIGYLHYFLTRDQSPFNFETYRFSPLDRFTSKLAFMVGETGVGIATSHYLPTWQAEDIDYSLYFKLHCYNLTTTYRSLRRELHLGVSLATK